MIKGIYEFISEAQLKKYAELAVRAGVNLQKNQLLIIHSDIQNAAFPNPSSCHNRNMYSIGNHWDN